MSLSRIRQRSRRARQLQRGLRSVLRLESLENRVVFSGASPIAVNDLYEAVAEETLEVSDAGVLANDTDAEGDALTAREFLGPKHGTLTLRDDGTFDYTPNPGFSGLDGFVYQAGDGTSDSQLAAVTIQVIDPNAAPTGVNDAFTVDEDTVLDVMAANGVLVNDTDEDGDTLTAELVDAPTNGMLEFQADGSFTYTPDANFFGSDAFTYRASDGEALSELVVVEITINSVNDAPLAIGEGFETSEDVALVIPAAGVLENDSDIEGDPLSAELEQGPQHGTLELNADGGFTYTPQANFAGFDVFSYRVSDGSASSEVVSAEIIVLPVSDAPSVNNDMFTTAEDEPLVSNIPGVLGNDIDPDGDVLQAELGGAPDYGTLEFNADGSFVYTPNTDFNGTDAFTYRVTDGESYSDLGVVEIVVTSVNDAPVATADEYTTDMDTPLLIPAAGVLENDRDVDGDQLMAILDVPPEHGTLELAEDGSFVYTPETGYSGPDQFSYQASDGEESAMAMVSILVQGVNQAPVATNDSYVATAGESLSVAADGGLLSNDTDPNGDPLTVALFRGPAHGELQLNDDGSFEYLPSVDYEGIDSFIYRATDGEFQSALAVVTLHVLPQSPTTDDPPVVTPDAGEGDPENATEEETPTTVAPEGIVEVFEENEPCEGDLAIELDVRSVDQWLGSMDLRGWLQFEFDCFLS